MDPKQVFEVSVVVQLYHESSEVAVIQFDRKKGKLYPDSRPKPVFISQFCFLTRPANPNVSTPSQVSRFTIRSFKKQ